MMTCPSGGEYTAAVAPSTSAGRCCSSTIMLLPVSLLQTRQTEQYGVIVLLVCIFDSFVYIVHEFGGKGRSKFPQSSTGQFVLSQFETN